MSTRPSTMVVAGIVLSQPEMVTSPSNMWLRATSATESALTSRLIGGPVWPWGGARGAVGDRDDAALQRGAARRANAMHDLLGQLAVIPVAGHGPDPAVGHADLRTREILVAEADRLHHGGGGGGG